MTIKIQTIVLGTLALALVVLGWLFFAPTQIGGSTSYMIIRGISMNPSIHSGDLVIVRERSSYSVNTVVAYRDTLDKQNVLHRIVAVKGDSYTFKGDNNPKPDPFQPAKAQLIGEKWIQIPYAGRALEWVQVPTNAAILAIAVILLTAGGGAATQRKRRRKSGPTTRATTSLAPRLNPLYAIPAALLVLSLALAAVAFNRPTSGQFSVPSGYQQSGDFSYSGSAKPGVVYPSGTVTTGQTVFSRLVKDVVFNFAYELKTDEATTLSGQATLNASLTSSDNHYTRSFTLAKRSFSGKAVRLTGVFPLRQYTDLLNQVQNETQDPSSTYSVLITPTIAVKGIVGDSLVNERFAPSLDFLLDTHKLLLDRSGGSVAMHVSKSSSRSGTANRANVVDLRVARPSVSTARALSIAGLVLALLSLLVVLATGARRRHGDEPEQIERQYGHLLLPVSELPSFERIVECDSIDALAALAERYDRAILYRREGGIHTYVLQDEGLAYRYSAFNDALLRPESYLPAEPDRVAEAPASETVPESWSVDAAPEATPESWGEPWSESGDQQSSEPPRSINE
ncbi:MAG: signal peptidase I [Gaiellaceae bacterium]